MTSTLVYIVEAQNGVAKIGCGYDPAQRLATIRTHSPVLTRLLAQWPGDDRDERALHARFEPYRLQCEWFQIDGDFRAFIVERHGVGLNRVEAWDELLFRNREGRLALSRRVRSEKMAAQWADPARKLRWLSQLRFGRMVRDAVNEGGSITAERRRSLRDEAHRITCETPAGQKLLAEISAPQPAAEPARAVG